MSLEKLMPLGDRVLLKRVEVEEKTASGIIIPDVAKEKTQICEVVAIGQGRTTSEGKVVPLVVTPGARVFVGKYSGTEVGDYVIVREEEILGILK